MAAATSLLGLLLPGAVVLHEHPVAGVFEAYVVSGTQVLLPGDDQPDPELSAHSTVEGGLLRAVTLVRACVTVEGNSRAGGHRSCAVMGVVFTMRSGSVAVMENSVPSGAGHGLAVQALPAPRLTNDNWPNIG